MYVWIYSQIYSMLFSQRTAEYVCANITVWYLNISVLFGIILRPVCQNLGEISPFASFYQLNVSSFICLLLGVQHKLGCNWDSVRSFFTHGNQIKWIYEPALIHLGQVRLQGNCDASFCMTHVTCSSAQKSPKLVKTPTPAVFWDPEASI